MASRAIEAHKQACFSGCLNNNLPKSSSNITFLSDANPLTTQNPLYIEGGGQSSDNLGLLWKSKFTLDKSSSRRRLLKDPTVKGNAEGLHRAWTLPSRFAKKNIYELLESPVIMDPIQCHQMNVQADCETNKAAKRKECPTTSPATSTNGKLSVKEQARQFEQNALCDVKTGKPWEYKEVPLSCNNDGGTEKNSKYTTDIDHAKNYRSSSLTQELHLASTPQISHFPYILVTPSELPEEISPPPTRKPTPPLFRKNAIACHEFQVGECEQVIPDLIPDPPNIPPPSPPPKESQSSPPTQSPCQTNPSCTTPPPPPLPAPSLPPSFSPFPNLPTPPPPPLPEKLLSPSPSNPSLSTLSPIPLSSAREKLLPIKMLPPEASHSDVGPKRELKGILKNLHNLADIEKSVANMYSQIDKGNALSKQATKPKSPVTTDIQNADSLPPDEQLNGNLSCVVGELEKRFPSQSTAL